MLKKLILTFLLITFATTSLFVGLHLYSNMAPNGLMLAKITQAFKNNNFSKHDYPFAAYGPFSLNTLVGQNQYTECELALTAMSQSGLSLKGAVLPSILTIQELKGGFCKELHAIIQDPENQHIKSQQLRPRYWWGGAAIMGSMLRHVNVFQLKELIKKMTTFAIVLLSIGLTLIDRRLLLVLSPLLGFTIFFSGITYYTDVALGVPFLWGVLVPAMLSFAIAFKAKKALIYALLFFSGTVSAYIWLIDGHLMMVVSWVVLICCFSAYCGTTNSFQLRQTIEYPFKAIIVFVMGFICSYICGQLLKIMYLGTQHVWQSMQEAVIHRTSSMHSGHEIEYSKLLESLWHHGFVWSDGLLMKNLVLVILITTSIALFCGLFLMLVCFLKSGRLFYPGFLILLIALHFFVRFYLMQNHSSIHAFFIGRYLFIPLALCWVLCLASLMEYKKIQKNSL